MPVDKKLGIWMNYTEAHLMSLAENTITTTHIQSLFTHDEKEDALVKGEKIMHHKEQQQHKAYFKKIAEAILNYNHVLVFGPTDAKVELQNFLTADKHFDKIKIVIKPADKMTENQEQAFVQKYWASPN